MDKIAAINDSRKYAEHVKKYFPECRIILYGSYANGNPDNDSDIDIAVVFNGFSGDWLQTSSQLWKETESVNTKIEPVLLDENKDASGFCEHVIETGIEL